jgi:hypothetical protein
MRQLIRQYFSFIQKERIAIVTLVALIVSVYLLPRFITSEHKPPAGAGWQNEQSRSA